MMFRRSYAKLCCTELHRILYQNIWRDIIHKTLHTIYFIYNGNSNHDGWGCEYIVNV